MNKAVKFILLPLSLLAAVGGALGGAMLIKEAIFSQKKQETAEELPDVAKTEIVYMMSMDDGETVKEVPAFMYYEEGMYPTSYVPGTKVIVSDLKGRVTRNYQEVYWDWDIDNPWDDGLEEEAEEKTPMLIGTETGWVTDPDNPNKEYEFKGWYLDVECTQMFKGFFPAGEGEPKMLYADVNMAIWIGPY